MIRLTDALSKGKDFLFNILAAIISTGIVQLVLYPEIAKKLSNQEYGIILTIMGILNILIVSCGNSLNNVRLIQNPVYINKKENGDFNLLLIIAMIFGSIILSILFSHMAINKTEKILLMFLLCLNIAKSYYIVAFRLIIQFKQILILSIISSLTYILAILINLDWIFIFISAEIISLIFLFCTTNLFREPFHVTSLFKESFNKFIGLFFINIFGNSLLYLDRLVLFPIFGGEMVAVYFAASFVGKCIGILTVPVSGVLLSYFSQNNFKMTFNKFKYLNYIGGITCLCAYFISIFISPNIIKLLYPSLAEQSMNYYYIANMAAILSVMCGIVQPVILKFSSMYTQIRAQVFYICIYLFCSYILTTKYELVGFCYAMCIANIFRLSLLIWYGSECLDKDER